MWKLRIWGFQNWPYFNIWKLQNQSYEPLKTNRDFYKLPVSINSHFGLFYFLSYCHISLHISDNLSPNLTSRDILRKKRTRAFIWNQTWWDFMLYCWRYGLLKSVRIYLTDPVGYKLSGVSSKEDSGMRLLRAYFRSSDGPKGFYGLPRSGANYF